MVYINNENKLIVGENKFELVRLFKDYYLVYFFLEIFKYLNFNIDIIFKVVFGIYLIIFFDICWSWNNYIVIKCLLKLELVF